MQAEGSSGEYAGGDGGGVPSLVKGKFNIPPPIPSPSDILTPIRAEVINIFPVISVKYRFY